MRTESFLTPITTITGNLVCHPLVCEIYAA
jgi:hypothetical protein